MGFVTIKNLRKEFGDLIAVNDVSFEIEEGSFTSIVGPSGSGKTTILRMIGGFETPTSGSIRIAGQDVTDQPPFARDVNMVFQDLALFPHMTVGENIEYGLKHSSKQLTKQERQDRIEEMLRMVDLQGYAPRDPAELSGGEQQRVAVARAVVNEPELLLFDEPLASLDRKLRQRMQVELQRIQSETDITFLYVTHDQEVALSVSDHLILLNEGSIEQQGTPQELYDDPSTPFTANFIGDINQLDASVESIGTDELTISADGFTETFPKELSDGEISTGESVLICVRPNAVQLTSDPSKDGGIEILGRTEGRTYRGDSFLYRVKAGEKLLTASNVTEKFDVNEDVYITWDLDETLIYTGEDRVPEERLAESEVTVDA